MTKQTTTFSTQANKQSKDPRFIWLRHQFYHRVVGKILPVKWFAPVAPRAHELNLYPNDGEKLKLQIVSHCWNYSHFLRYQLSSLIQYPSEKLDITYSLYFCEEDVGTKEMINAYKQISVPNFQWDLRPMIKERLFRRAIGRNEAALNTEADWVFFVDCDIIMHEGCLDSIANALHRQALGLAYPASEGITELLPANHPLLTQEAQADGTVTIDASLFSSAKISKPKGGYQFLHGDVARAAGYCGSISLYQTPSSVWRKTFEDTTFRTLIQYDGEPIAVRNLYRIRHQEKGRYQKETFWGKLRKKIRTIVD